jgi:hypothetical protein
MITRNDILRKTHYGLSIIGHFLREHYPEEVVMHLVGRDAGMCPNPWDEGRPTLHVWHEKVHPEKSLSDEVARYHDESGHIADGDCFDYAVLETGLHDQELFVWLDETLSLHIAKPVNFYEKPVPVPVTETAVSTESTDKDLLDVFVIPRFSFFKAPIRNTIPYKAITPFQAWKYITGPYAAKVTEDLRNLTDKKAARAYKAQHFAYACFSGDFSKRSDDAVLSLSGLMCLDFDHVASVEELKGRLLKDKMLETVLLFRSPSGDGIKWVVRIEYDGHTHQQVFSAIQNYVRETYGVEVDPSGKDISRACFLPCDPDAFIGENYKEQ